MKPLDLQTPLPLISQPSSTEKEGTNPCNENQAPSHDFLREKADLCNEGSCGAFPNVEPSSTLNMTKNSESSPLIKRESEFNGTTNKRELPESSNLEKSLKAPRVNYDSNVTPENNQQQQPNCFPIQEPLKPSTEKDNDPSPTLLNNNHLCQNSFSSPPKDSLCPVKSESGFTGCHEENAGLMRPGEVTEVQGENRFDFPTSCTTLDLDRQMAPHCSVPTAIVQTSCNTSNVSAPSSVTCYENLKSMPAPTSFHHSPSTISKSIFSGDKIACPENQQQFNFLQ